MGFFSNNSGKTFQLIGHKRRLPNSQKFDEVEFEVISDSYQNAVKATLLTNLVICKKTKRAYPANSFDYFTEKEES